MSALETHATKIARDTLGEGADETSGDFITILTALLTVLPTLLQLCPQSQAAKSAALRKPTVLQRAMFLKNLKDTCECCGYTSRAKIARLNQYAVARGAMLTDDEAAAVVEDSSDDANLLI